MIHFDKQRGLLLLRLPRGDIPFHYGPDVKEGYRDMADAEEHVAKMLTLLDVAQDHWIWMGDGRDDLNSMCEDLVIRITAGDLRRLIFETEKKVHLAHAPNAPRPKDCPTCDGVGQLDTERGGTWVTCSTCHGTGKKSS